MSALKHKTEMRAPKTNQKHKCRRSRGMIYASAITVVVILTLEASTASCEAKEFDWGELGVQLANAKPALSGQSASNLRILVSPQRRMTKNYEFEYTNSSQVQPSQGDASSYVLSSSNGSPYLTQSVYQLTPNHTIHSSAYSALSASLASLKSRLNARGVSLSSTLGENGSQPTTSHLYSTQNSYGSSVLLEPNQQPGQQSQQQVGQAPSQPTYLSMSSQQEQQGGATYTVPPSQSNDNKTIVLAIPAKINFLTGAKQQPQQQQQQQQLQQAQPQQHPSQHQAQQLSVLQATADQQARPEYATKQQLGVLNPDGTLETQAQPGSEQQEHHQYVIVNQTPQLASGDHHSHSVAANLAPAAAGATGQVYSTIYQAAPSALSQISGYAMKYVPAYTSQSGQLQQALQPATIQKVYSVIEPQALSAGQQQQQLQSPLPQVQASYEAQLVAEHPAMGSRYLSCLDTCNSADPRWRKYTVSKYKACCSRSSQFDAAFEQPSADKVSESSSRYADDAYYNYLYRRSRARRSRRLRQGRNYYGSSSGRYYGNSASSPTSSSGQADEEAQVQEPQGGENGAARAVSSTGRTAYYNQDYPYSKQQYRAGRGYGSGSAAAPPASIQDAPLESAGRDEPASGSKYAVTKERSHRRGRSRELEPLGEPQPVIDNVEDDSIYPPPRAGPPAATSGYGNNDYSVDAQGRYSAPDGARGGPSLAEEDEQARFDEPTELDSERAKSEDYAAEGAESSVPGDEAELEGLSAGQSYKYPSSSGASSSSNRRKKSQAKLRQQRRPLAAGKDLAKYYKKSRKNKYGKSAGEHAAVAAAAAAAANGTDYESAQPGEYHQEQANGSGGEQEEQAGYSGKSSQSAGSPYEQSESDKEAILAKYRASLNETTVANLSKTTMHLKEILSILEKKAHLRSNDTGSQQQASALSQQQQQQQQQQPPQAQQQSLPATSTLPPVTTTTLYPPLSSLLSGSPYSSPLSSDFLASDFGLKSPYRFESSSLSSAPLSLPSSFGSFGASDAFSPLTPPYPSHYGMHSGKHLGTPNGPQRKRRPSKNGRYNDLMFQKAAHSLMNQPSLLQAASKNRFLSPAYYSALQYPYLYRGTAPTITNPYPYKNIHKNPYSSLLGGSMSSKLTGSSQLYTDESRIHGLTGLDPLSNMASSLRPSSAMRLRNKPFVFQPQVLPIYTRHTILAPSLDVKA